MTINQLIKKLEKIQAKHGKRVTVVANLEAMRNSTPDDFTHCTFKHVEFEMLPWAVEDSFELADGSERIRRVVSIGGST